MRVVLEIALVMLILLVLAMCFTKKASSEGHLPEPPKPTERPYLPAILSEPIEDARARSVLWESDRPWLKIRRVTLWPGGGSVARLTFEME